MTDTRSAPPSYAGSGAAATGRVLLLGGDASTRALFAEWLTEAGHRVVEEPAALQAGEDERPSLAVVDLPYARRGMELLRSVAERWPGTPVLVLSPTLFSHVRFDGPCARLLGVAGALPKPVGRDALVSTVSSLLTRSQ